MIDKKEGFRLEKEQVPMEVKKYNKACGLLESMDCVIRLEHQVMSVETAKKLFLELGEYEDSPLKAEECQKLEDKLVKKGKEKIYQSATLLFENSTNSSELRVAIHDFRRIKDYKDAKKMAVACQKKITSLELKRGLRRLVITIMAVAVFLGIFFGTPCYSYTKGMMYLTLGQYRLALQNFHRTEGFLDTKTKIRLVYYTHGNDLVKKEKYEKAIKEYEKSGYYKDSRKRIAEAMDLWGEKKVHEILKSVNHFGSYWSPFEVPRQRQISPLSLDKTSIISYDSQ